MFKMFILSIIISVSCLAQEITLTSPVMDQANVLTNESSLEAKIRAVYKNGSGPQINILMIDSLKGQAIEEFAVNTFTKWKLGDAKRDDGVLLVIAVKDRKSRIEVGQGLEGGLTDVESKRILDSLKPFFRSSDFNGGVNKALDQIIHKVTQKDAVQQVAQSPKSNGLAKVNEDVDDNLISLVSFLMLLVGLMVNFKFWRKQAVKVETESDLLKSAENDLYQAQKNNNAFQTKIKELEAGGLTLSTIKNNVRKSIDSVMKLIIVEENLQDEKIKLIRKKVTLAQNDKAVVDKQYDASIHSKIALSKVELKSVQSSIADSKVNQDHYRNFLAENGES